MAANANYPTVEDAYKEGKDIMRRGGKKLGVLTPGGPEDVRFRSFFGAGAEVILNAWHRMAELDLLPPDRLFLHYLWALLFMCIYPKNEAALCTLVGGHDPKTVRAKTWPFIYALSELSYSVVRHTLSSLPLLVTISHIVFLFARFCLRTGSLGTLATPV